MSATQGVYCNTDQAGLYLAFELGATKWKLAFTVGFGQKPRIIDLAAGNVIRLAREIKRAKKRFGLPDDAPVHSCYEAGRDGFWLHRYLVRKGIDSIIVDSSSIEVNRRKRRAKNDRLDAEKLVTMLMRFHHGETKVWSTVRVPSVEDEDGREPDREVRALKDERTKHVNRIRGLLASRGLPTPPLSKSFPIGLAELRVWWDDSEDSEGSELPPALRRRLLREFERLELLQRQIKEVTQERLKRIGQDRGPQAEQMRKLLGLRGIGPGTASPYVTEFFGWRQFRNRREVASLAGLTPTPYASGDDDREQGISKAGNGRIRALAIESAWNWLRFQGESELSQWYKRRFASGNKRQRKIGIVALARKLLTQLWQYLETGVPPRGAIMTDWRSKIPKSAIAEV
jgi:transposase